jgi:hypothetical protein
MVEKNKVIDLSPLTGPNAQLTGINNKGSVCGYLEGAVSGFVIDHAGLSGNAVVTMIPPPPGHAKIEPVSISEAGDLVIFAENPTVFIYRDTSFIQLGPSALPEALIFPRLNAAGQLAGLPDASGQPVVWDTTAIPPKVSHIPTPEGFVGGGTNAMSDNGVVVGACWDASNNVRSFINYGGPTSALLGDLITTLGYGDALPWAINKSGQIIIGDTPSVLLTPRSVVPPGPRANPRLSSMVATILFGIIGDGGGSEVVGGGGEKIPPGGPPDGWDALSPAVQDALIGLAVYQFAGEVRDHTGRDAVGRAALELARSSIARLQPNPSPSPSARTVGRARSPYSWSRFAGARRPPKPDPSSA